MNTPITLAEALRRAGDQLEQAMPPTHGAAAVRAALPRPPAPAAAATLRRPWAWSGALACTAVLGVSLLLMLRSPVPGSAAPELRLSGFLPVVPVEDWPAEDAPAWLVSTELRRDRLAAFGLPFDPSRAADSVRAEVLVRASGQVLAVRFLP